VSRGSWKVRGGGIVGAAKGEMGRGEAGGGEVRGEEVNSKGFEWKGKEASEMACARGDSVRAPWSERWEG